MVQVNSRRVSATANANLGTYFMRLIGIDDLLVPDSSTAMESVQDIEIVLVLDVSGSMETNGSQRLANLRPADDPDEPGLAAGGHFDAYGSLAALNGNYEAPLPFGTNTNSTWSQYGSDFTPRLIPVCRLHAGNTVQVPTSDAATLRGRIAARTNRLLSGGVTSSHLGMKWGLMMLDPSFRTVLTSAGMTGLPGRPFD